MSEYQIN